ncbi:MAG: gamma-glutamyl-gamma-aminobutyrate hydrolase family protein [Acidobacteriales bacterium]|nr:gamma-glutamyl-gamma-aminobutyrate hydrolase family protein [Candidatus Koribacter versatilis]MBI3645568.1 gamma-glutamyl-gamma-aminobutyrate hydrolase family protein [Terriglobales bacterium]
MTTPRIAIPVPHSGDREYAERALPQYEEAVRLAGGEPIRIELDQTPTQVMKQIERCDAVLLPGSRADVDPQKYDADRHQKTAPADPRRDTVDELLLQDAYNMRKPVLAICYGLQTLNVYRSGTLVQHIETAVNHSAGRAVPNAHTVEIEPDSQLAKIVAGNEESTEYKSAAKRRKNSAHGVSRGSETASDQAPKGRKTIPVNSSHHQSADAVGDGLRVVARSPQDGVIEALEGTLPGHFVLAVQWHPERSVHDAEELAESAKAIFQAFIEAARAKHAALTGEFESASSQ